MAFFDIFFFYNNQLKTAVKIKVNEKKIESGEWVQTEDNASILRLKWPEGYFCRLVFFHFY